jgi:small conductance mechanosensitive channel
MPVLSWAEGPALIVGWDEVIDWAATNGVRIGIILAIAAAVDLALHRLIPRAVRLAVERQLRDKPQEEIDKRIVTLAGVFTGTGRAILIAVAAFTILPVLGINIGPLLASVGIVGLALGFGAQSLVKDIISGLFILLDNQYGKGDVVTVGGISGLVEDVGLRRTVLRDLDGIVHYIPNGEISVASNFTQEWSRVNMNVSVSYGEDLDHVFEVINRVGRELAEDHEFAELILDPPHVLRVDAFEDSGIAIKVLGDTKPIRQWDVMGELRLRLKKAFDEEGIEIPFPHRVMVTRGAKATDAPEPTD